jgi:cytosine/adenosine deaminase-related metal-dependent hydrolase
LTQQQTGGRILQVAMIIAASKLLTLQDGMKPIDNGAVVLNHGVIEAAGPARWIINKYPRHRVHRFNNALLMPGLVNVHTHLELPPLLNAIRAKSFPEWIINLIAAKKDLDQTHYSKSASANIKALIEAGTTTVGEICTHRISPSLLKHSGLRAVVFREIISMSHHSINLPLPSSANKHVGGLVHFGLSPHAPHTVSESAAIRIRELSIKMRIRLTMHVAESKDELRLLRGKRSGLEKLYQFAHWDLAWAPSGSSSFEYLDRIGFLSPYLLAVHAVQVTDRDLALIKKSKTSVAHCPRSNKELGVGRMPLRKFLDAGITVGLGTDSLASSPSLNIWDEMRYAYQIHRRNGVSSEDIFRIATINGARALGLDKEIGSIKTGKMADIIAVRLPKKNTGNLYLDLLRETSSCIMSMVNGKILYKDE